MSVGVALLATPGVALAAPQLPSADPFYAAPAGFAAAKPGTILRTRQVPFEIAGIGVPFNATQVLYRTTTQLGDPTVTVATVLRPLVGNGNVVSYQEAYDDLGGSCAPSYTLQGGNTGDTTALAEHPVMSAFLAAGDTVVDADYEGEDLAYGAGQQSGYQTLDGIRAAESLLAFPSSTKVAMVGYSGGSIASEYAAELAPSYAPELNIVGTAIGGIPVDYVHNLNYINGTPSWSDVMPAIFVGLARAFHIDLDKYLSPLGQELTKQDADKCIASYLGAHPGLKYQDLAKPQYRDVLSIPLFATTMNRETMSYTGTPREPLYLGVGNVDGKGDGVMVAQDVVALGHAYCQRGLSVEFHEYKRLEHTTAALEFFPAAIVWLTARLNGVAPTNGCSSIGTGNSLALLPVPAAAGAKPRIRLQVVRASQARGLVIRLASASGTLRGLVVELKRGAKVELKLTVKRLTSANRRLVLRVGGRPPRRGRHTIVVRSGKRALVSKRLTVR